MERDFVDQVLDQWQEQRPDLDVSPIGVISRLMRITRRLERILGQSFERRELAMADFDVLAALRRSGPPFEMALGTLNEWLLSNNSTMTYRVDRLIAAGYVERWQNPANRRTALVRLTDSGRDVVDRLAEAHFSEERELLAGLDESKRDELADLLRRFCRSLGDTEPERPPHIEDAAS